MREDIGLGTQQMTQTLEELFTRSLSDARDRSPTRTRLNQTGEYGAGRSRGGLPAQLDIREHLPLTHAFTEAPCADLGGRWDPRGTGHSLEELAHFSNEISPSPVSLIVPDHSANPFHMSGDMDFFLLRDQERNKSRSVSIRTKACPQLFPPSHKQQPDF